MTATRTTCPYCGVGCGVLATADGAISGDAEHPANAGRLCSKGTALGETLGLDNRQLHPEVDGVRTDWTTALDRVANGFARTIAQYGPDSVALYVSGQLLTEDYYAANKLAKAVLGTANIDSNSRLCMASSVAGHKRAFGEDLVPGVYEDLELADLVVLVGSNTAWCHPVLYQRLQAARARRPIRLVVLDPRRTATCEDADLHLPLAPGSDVALFSGLLAHLATKSDDPVVALARRQTPDAATTAALCGLKVAAVETFFAWFAGTEKVVTLFSQGVNQSSAGTDKVNAILNVHLLTGRIAQPGAGPFSVTGQPNAMGGREVGALANMLAAHLEWERPGDAAMLSRFWGTDRLPQRPGLKAVELFRAIADKRVRAVWIIATNPAVSLPDSAAVRAALAGCDLVVVSDCEAGTDTARFAHVVLPALAWGEKDGTVTNSERVISRQRAFLPAPGEARADWWALAQVAARLGRDFGWTRPAEIFREHAALSGFGNDGARVFDISGLAGLSDADYDALAPTRWPCPKDGPGETRIAATRRGRLVPTALRAPETVTDAAFPLVLLTGRVRDQWHTMTRTARSPRLLAHVPEPFLAMHPGDTDLPDGALVRIATRHGAAVLRLRHDAGLRRGCVFAPMHWTDALCGAGRINPAVSPAVDPVSGQPELKYTPAAVGAYAAGWHGFVLTRANLGAAMADWGCVIPLAGGVWRHELAGPGAPALGFAGLAARLGVDAGWMRLEDAGGGRYRAALVRDGVLQACLFVGPDHVLPPRSWLAEAFAAPVTRPVRAALLAGFPASGAQPTPMVCVCHGIDAGRIAAAIAGGCDTVAAVGVATLAGTGCGSCRPEISALLTHIMAAA